jgi:hypothetical protein
LGVEEEADLPAPSQWSGSRFAGDSPIHSQPSS